MDGYCFYTPLTQGIDLVPHERYQGGNNDTYSRPGQSRDLKSNGLSSPGGHKGQGIPVLHYGVNNFLLQGPKPGKVPVIIQYFPVFIQIAQKFVI